MARIVITHHSVAKLGWAGTALAGLASIGLIASSFAAQSLPSLLDKSKAIPVSVAKAPTPGKVRLTVLNDAFGGDARLQKDWGYAALVEYGGKRILFDTGNNAEVLAKNAKAKGISLASIDYVVISHRHGDHIGGLSLVQKLSPEAVIYAPKEGFGVFGSSLPSTFYRKDTSLGAEQRYFGGSPPETLQFGSAWPAANIRLLDKNKEIAPGIHLLSLVSDKPGTLELRELSLVLNTPTGAVVVVGCSHPGIEKIVESATSINPHIALVAGGFHLVVAKDEDINRVTSSLKDQFKVSYIAPGHCTGEPTFNALQKAFGNRYLYSGVGTTIDQSSLSTLTSASPLTPRRTVALGELDSRNYRKLLAISDDNGHAVIGLHHHSH